MVEVDAQFLLRDLDHQAVVGEGLRAQQPERPGDLAPPLVHPSGLHRPRHAGLAAHARRAPPSTAPSPPPSAARAGSRSRCSASRPSRARRRASVTTVGFGVPGPVVGELGRARPVDLAVGQTPQQQSGDGAAVLAVHLLVRAGRAGQDDLAVLPDHLVRRACLAEEQLVDLRFPFAEPWARPGADVAPLVAVGAPIRSLRLELDREVVLVPEDVEGAGDDACGASRAQTRRARPRCRGRATGSCRWRSPSRRSLAVETCPEWRCVGKRGPRRKNCLRRHTH